jgi:hypothetical protein
MLMTKFGMAEKWMFRFSIPDSPISIVLEHEEDMS